MGHLNLDEHYYKPLRNLLEINGYLKFSTALSKESKGKILDSTSSLERSKSLIEELNRQSLVS